MTKPWRYIEQEETPEGTTVVINVTRIEDESDPPQVLGAADIDSMEATIWEASTLSIVDDWNHKDVLGVNGGTFDGNVFRLRLGPTDTVPIRPTSRSETWIVMLRYKYNGGADAGHQEISLPLSNRPHVPATS